MAEKTPSMLASEADLGEVRSQHDGTVAEGGLQKSLKDRHLSMIALGGALGTGLLVGTGSALAKTGPAGIFIDFSVIGLTVFCVMAALGEMLSFAPMARGFGGYATRFVDPALGFATGYAYLFKYLLATPNQMAATALIMEFWTQDRINPAVWISIVLVLIIIVNFCGVKVFGEMEFWVSSLKVIILTGVILIMLILACGGGPTHDVKGFKYWSDPGAFAEYKVKGDVGKFTGVWSTMIQAVYAFGGTELVGVTVAEAKNPRIAMPKAVKMTFFRIAFFYIVSVFLLGMVVPYNSPELAFALTAKTSAAASPFVVAITNAKIKGLDHVINASLLIFVVSSAVSDLYISTRTLYGIACDGKAPKILTRTTKLGVPYVAMIIPLAFTCLSYMSVQAGAKQVFNYLTNMVAIFGMLTWIGILVSHVGFIKATKAQQIPDDRFPYRSPFGLVGSYIALAFLSILILTKSFDVFVGGFDYKGFIVGYIGLPVYLTLLFGYKFWRGTKRVTNSEADLVTGVPTISFAEERALHEAEERERAKDQTGVARVIGQVYRRTLAWLF
ncbi:unnamed protein product [Clonostachys byssicola]|uniref:Amino acid permease/ SLC12A domain-containing protein n=1 Tax=Clonostachys byssicola TaxID=160290 RepID=A0A9N9U454_9HYPO|nr:unnamed protein product [Clonostachys byssicola]